MTYLQASQLIFSFLYFFNTSKEFWGTQMSYTKKTVAETNVDQLLLGTKF